MSNISNIHEGDLGIMVDLAEHLHNLRGATPQAVARLFSEMGSEEQAAFFDELHRIVTSEWGDGVVAFRRQMGYVMMHVEDSGKEIVQIIGEVG